jgi:hypothetical protein
MVYGGLSEPSGRGEGAMKEKRLTPSLMLRMLKKPTTRTMKLAMSPELPETKVCHCCGAEFPRPTHTRDGRRALRWPGAWKRQRFCSTECVRHYRLEGPVKEWLPPFLQALEPVRGSCETTPASETIT